MRWTVLNALGGLIWLAGIMYAKGATGLAVPSAASEGHNVAVGLAMGAMGLALLLWANLRSAN